MAECEPHPFNKMCPQPRLYRGLYLETAKKNGKTQIGAGLGGYLAFGDGEPGAEVYTYAADRDQARLAFDALSFGVSYKGSPFEKKGIKPLKTSITNHRTRSFVRVQSSAVGTKHGPNANGIIFDELHAQPNRDLWDVVTTGVANRRQPLIAALTTAGWDRLSICYEQHEHARQVSEGIMDDPTFLGVVYSCGEEDDWTKPETWRKAAPSLGVTVKEAFYEQKAREAEQMPSAQNAFLQLFLSRWTQQAVRVIPLKAWDRGAEPVVDLEAKTKRTL
jgi:phage terminase large subunit-like protein